MALTRKMLEALGVEEKAIEQIIDAHVEVVSGLKDKLRAAEEDAGKYNDAKKELDGLKADDYKAKYEKEHSEYEAFKKSVAEKETKTAKEQAVRAFFEKKGITGTNLDIAMRGVSNELAELEIVDGKIKDTKALDELVSGTYAGLVTKTSKQGAQTPTPQNNAGGGSALTRKEIMEIKDTTERQKAWAEYLMKGGK